MKELETGFPEPARKLFQPFLVYRLIAFTLPLLPSLLPFLIGLLILSILFNLKNVSIQNFPKAGLIFIAFYLLHFLGLLTSENTQLAAFDLEVKMSLLIFPLIFFTDQLLTESMLKYILRSFISGCLVAVIICLGQSAYKFSLSADYNVFSYTSLSPFLHTSYLAMYLNFGLIAALYLLRNTSSDRTLLYIFIPSAIIFIVLLSSKAAFLSLLLTIIFFIYFLVIHRKFKQLVIILFLISVGSAVLFSIPNVRYRAEGLTGLFSTSSAGSDANILRKQTWSASLCLIKNNLITGTGTGDVTSELTDIYKEKGFTTASDRKLNSHNQFLQTFAGLGIFGFLVITTMLFWPLYLATRRRFFVYAFFLGLIILNLLFESMFQTQAGVIFYAFFNSLFFSLLVRMNVSINTQNS